MWDVTDEEVELLIECSRIALEDLLRSGRDASFEEDPLRGDSPE